MADADASQPLLGTPTTQAPPPAAAGAPAPVYSPPPAPANEKGAYGYEQSPPGYQAAPGAYYGSQPMPQQPVGYAQPAAVVISAVPLHNVPVTMQCPHCHAHITTKTEYKSGALTWLMCGGLVLFGCICGCCLIPFHMDSAKVRLLAARVPPQLLGRATWRLIGRLHWGAGREGGSQDVHHSCPNCNQVVGIYSRI